jgi:putative ABC transport system permease protein
MRAIAWLAGHTNSVSFLMATRHLARTPGNYSMPLVLLILTLSLSAFTATLARTLDKHLHERTYYQIGADLKFSELGEWIPPNPLEITPAQGDEQDSSQWDFTPVSEYLAATGVHSVARVGRYPAIPRLTAGSAQNGVFLGVDRYYLPGIAFWRGDFSPNSLGALMNELALTPEGVLVDRNFMRRSALQHGDTINLSVETIGQTQEIELKIVGSFDLFPTWYPEDGALFVGNLYYLFDEAGGEFPYQVWLSTDPNMNQQTIVDEGLRSINPAVLEWDSSLIVVDEEQSRPERQGLFGLLSIGFAAAALLTVIGFLLYAYFSFRRRFIELGVLRAVGLSAGRMTSYLAWELTFLILLGVGIGTALGTWMSILFIPYLQVGTEAAARIPPYQVWIDWSSIFQIYALFGLLFLITLGVLVVLLKRMKIFQAIKLGETI